MIWLRRIAIGVLAIVFVGSLLAGVIAPAPYAKQFREDPDSAPSREHWLGTDDLGRDRFSRVLYGTRISLLLAPAAALLAAGLAGLIGGVAGYHGGWTERGLMAATDLVLSLPWLFLLLAVRALMPLNVEPIHSVTITFLILGCLGWAAGARVVCAGARALRNSEFALQARALGCTETRLLLRHIAPNLRPILITQFWISIPVFILAEANLGILGLGVSEPLPSWGSLLRELEGLTAISGKPWVFVPLLLLVVAVTSFQLLLVDQEMPS
jgi:peptide/nickel transport system permease protein